MPKALPDGALISKNKVEDNSIPDVPMTHPQAAAIYKLYRAGILQGDDATTHKCLPDKNILRCEVAAILTRMMDVEERISFTTVGALVAVVTPDNVVTSTSNTALFRVTVSGGTPGYKFQWQYINDNANEWQNCGGNTNQQIAYSTEALQISHFKYHYQYRCKVTDEKGNVTYSNTARISAPPITVKSFYKSENLHPAIEVQPQGGISPYVYEWQYYDDQTHNWCQYNSETIVSNNEYSRVLTEKAHKYYRCKITDSVGNVIYSKTFGDTIK